MLWNLILLTKGTTYYKIQQNSHEMENYILALDPTTPLFIVGDLNMDFISNNGADLQIFMDNNHLLNFVMEPTRVCTKYYSSTNSYRTSHSLIDVVLHNDNMIINVNTLGCPFATMIL